MVKEAMVKEATGSLWRITYRTSLCMIKSLSLSISLRWLHSVLALRISRGVADKGLRPGLAYLTSSHLCILPYLILNYEFVQKVRTV